MAGPTIESLTLIHARVSPKTVWSFVTLALADGTTGTGEASLTRNPAALDAPFRAARATLAGGDLDAALAYPVDDPAMPLAEAAVASAVEQAAQDAAARHARESVADRLGGTSNRIVALYANINRRTLDRTPAGFAASARDAIFAGFTALKIAPFDDLTPDNATSASGSRLVLTGLERVAAVSELLGPEHELMVDCHWRFPPALAADVGDALAERGVTWFECPIVESPAAIPDLKRLRARANARGMRLAGLEELPAPAAFRAYLEAGAYDVVMPDVKYAGGMAGMLAIALAARTHGAVCAPHNPTGPICHAASLAVCAAAELLLLEHQFDETPLFFTLAGRSLPRPVAGASALPDGPGLGIGLDVTVLPAEAVVVVA